MKKTLFATLILCVVSVATFAQKGQGRGQGRGQAQAQGNVNHAPGAKHGERGPKLTLEERAAKQTEHLNQIVGLSADQASKVATINKSYIEKIQAIRKGKKGEMTEADKTAIKDLQKQRHAEVKSVLTPEQIEKWKAHHKAEREKVKSNESKGGVPQKSKSIEEQPGDLD